MHRYHAIWLNASVVLMVTMSLAMASVRPTLASSILLADRSGKLPSAVSIVQVKVPPVEQRLKYMSNLNINWNNDKQKIDVASEIPMLSKLTMVDEQSERLYKRSTDSKSNQMMDETGNNDEATDDADSVGMSRQSDYGTQIDIADDESDWYIVKFTPQNEKQLSHASDLLRLEDPAVDFLKEPNDIGDAVHILLSPARYEVYIDRLKEYIDDEMITIKSINLKEKNYNLAPLDTEYLIKDLELNSRVESKRVGLSTIYSDMGGKTNGNETNTKSIHHQHDTNILPIHSAAKFAVDVVDDDEKDEKRNYLPSPFIVEDHHYYMKYRQRNQIDPIDRAYREKPPPSIDSLLLEPNVTPRFKTYKNILRDQLAIKLKDAKRRLKSRLMGGYGLGQIGDDHLTARDYYKKHHHVNDNLQHWLNLTRKYPQFMRYQTIAHTSESRPVYLFKIGFYMQSNPLSQDRPIILIDALHHGREWATLTTSSYFMEQLVADMAHGVDGDALKNYDYFIVPMINPDGYHFSITSGYPFWRKNRKTTGDIGAHDECVGVDLKKNYPTVAGLINQRSFNIVNDDEHRSFNTCSQYYPDEMPLSEPETNGLDSILRKYAKQIKLYLNLNAYGKQLAPPNIPIDRDELLDPEDQKPMSDDRLDRADDDTTGAKDADKSHIQRVARKFIRILNKDDSYNNKFKQLENNRRSKGQYSIYSYRSKYVHLGNSVIHAHTNYKINLSYALYLPPHADTLDREQEEYQQQQTGEDARGDNWGFFLTSEEILPVARNLYLAIMAFVDIL